MDNGKQLFPYYSTMDNLIYLPSSKNDSLPA